MQIIKIRHLVFMLFLISCVPKENIFIVEYINLIGQNLPDEYTFIEKPEIIHDIPHLFPSPHENGNVYRKTIQNNNNNTEEIIILIVDNSNIIRSCYITYTFSDFDTPRKYYDQLYTYIKKDKWQFVDYISKTKLQGETYQKNNIFIGIYEPINFISIGITTNKDNFILEGFCHGNNTINIEMIHPIEYYKSEITKHANDYYGFEKISMEINQMMNISSIVKIDNFIPANLTFLVTWHNMKGYIYYLYAFDNNQQLVNQYYLGDMFLFENHKILMDKLTGEKLQYGNISIGDFNNDGLTEILLFSQYKNKGYVFIIFGFNVLENKLEELLLVPVYINLETPFPPVEYTENDFKILEIIDEENMDLSWNTYSWSDENERYIKILMVNHPVLIKNQLR